jgi:hypothetical protein
MEPDQQKPVVELPSDILKAHSEAETNYVESDVFAWANNLVQYKDELKIDVFFFNKNYVMYKVLRSPELDKMLEPIFIDGLLEYILEGVENGLIVREFEAAEAEQNVLQKTRLRNVEKAVETLDWVKTQEHEIETFSDEEHDIKRVKGVLARVSHKDAKQPFYVVKALQQSQVVSGKAGWLLRDGKFKAFDADAALRLPTDNQLLILDQDMYVFSQPKLKTLFGYDAKESLIAEGKVREIEELFKLSFAEGLSMQSLVKGNRSIIKKLQKVEPALVKQTEMIDHAEELGVSLMTDEAGAIIIMDEKDMATFVNLMNDDYVESPLTGLRYEIKSKRILKPPSDEDLLTEVLT